MIRAQATGHPGRRRSPRSPQWWRGRARSADGGEPRSLALARIFDVPGAAVSFVVQLAPPRRRGFLPG